MRSESDVEDTFTHKQNTHGASRTENSHFSLPVAVTQNPRTERYMNLKKKKITRAWVCVCVRAFVYVYVCVEDRKREKK